MEIKIRELQLQDCEIISDSFQEQGWNKPVEQYLQYLEEQKTHKRNVLVAFYEGKFAGYVTVKWESSYSYFKDNNIPEIMDLNVLKKYRQNGIGSKLIDEAEQVIATRSQIIGIGVGLISDYGSAQSLYIKRGYVPDKNGISQYGKYLTYNDNVEINDDLVMYLTKKLVEK